MGVIDLNETKIVVEAQAAEAVLVAEAVPPSLAAAPAVAVNAVEAVVAAAPEAAAAAPKQQYDFMFWCNVVIRSTIAACLLVPFALAYPIHEALQRLPLPRLLTFHAR